MQSGPFVKIEMQDHGEAFLVSWSKGEVTFYRAFGNLDRAKGFAEAFIGRTLTCRKDFFGMPIWEASL